MKIESRFLILIASILLGCVTGLLYYNQGDLFLAHSFNPDESDDSFNFTSERTNTTEKSLKDEIRQQLSANHTLYEFTSATEQKKAETSAQPEPTEQLIASKDADEADAENLGDVLAKMAENSPELNDSLNALTEARKASAEQLTQKKQEDEPVTEQKPRSLISVNDYSQATPVFDANPAENQGRFQAQSTPNAQNALSHELVAQAQSPTPIPTSIPIQTSAPIQNSIPIQTSAPMETPELIQTSALVQTPSLPQAITPLEMIADPGDFEEAPINQAVGSIAAPPNTLSLPVRNNSEDLDQNPLVPILGVNPPENANEAEISNEEEPELDDEAETQPANQAAFPAEAQAEPQVVTQPQFQPMARPQDEIQRETESYFVNRQSAESSFSHQPTRIKKPNRNLTEDQAEVPTEESAEISTEDQTEDQTRSETGTPIQKEEYSLDLYRVDLRKALASYQIETGLKVVAALDVQGTVSCKSRNADPEILLGSLLADTPFKFVRSGNFVYVAHSSQLGKLPDPLEKTATHLFTPVYISLEELELVFRSNLTQFGTCEVAFDSLGQKCLSVTDWVLSLEQLEKIQQIVDVPAPEEQMNAFVFQRELDGTFKALDLLEIAESQGLVLQSVAPLETGTREDKKSFFYGAKTGSKKEKSSEIQAYTISYRADSFMASVRQQLKTRPAPMPGQTFAPLELNQPMKFDFNLNVQDRLVPYQITVTYRQDPQNEGGINAEVDCAPSEDLGPKAKAKDFHFTLAIPSQSRNSLILQLELGEFPVENSGSRKDISYAIRGNRMKKEVIVVLQPFQSVPKIRKNGLSTQAVREIIRQQEVLARKFYGSMNQSEREDSRHCLGIAQRLRLSLGETGGQGFDPGFAPSSDPGLEQGIEQGVEQRFEQEL